MMLEQESHMDLYKSTNQGCLLPKQQI